MRIGPSPHWISATAFLAFVSCQSSSSPEPPSEPDITGKWRYEKLIIPSTLTGLSHSGSAKGKLEFAIARTLEFEQQEATALVKEREDLPVFRANMLKLNDFVASFQDRSLTYRTKPDALSGEALRQVDLFEAFYTGAKLETPFDPGDWMNLLGRDVRAGRFEIVLDEAQAMQKYSDAVQYRSPEGQKRLANDVASVRKMFKLIQSDDYDRWPSKKPRTRVPDPFITTADRVDNPYVNYAMGQKGDWWGTSIPVDPSYLDDLSVLVGVEKEMKALSINFLSDGTYTVSKAGNAPEVTLRGTYTLGTDGTIIRRLNGTEPATAAEYVDNIVSTTPSTAP
jgi:hypothetical protein